MRTVVLVLAMMVLEGCSGSPDGRIFESSDPPADDAGSSSASSSSSSSTSSSSTATTSASTASADPVTSITCGGMTVDCTTGNYTDNVGLSGSGATITYAIGATRYWCEPGAPALPPCPTGTACVIYRRSADGGASMTVGTFACNE